jgi:hypothetical protein
MKTIPNLLRLVCLSSPLLLLACGLAKDKREGKSIPYPEPRPDSVALFFLPGLVSSDSIDFSSAFSPEGKSFYFRYLLKNSKALFLQ